MSPTLDMLKPGTSGVIAAVGGSGALRRRLLDMGLTPKTPITVHKVAPMGDPIEIHLRGYALTLRKEEAAKIDLLPLDTQAVASQQAAAPPQPTPPQQEEASTL